MSKFAQTMLTILLILLITAMIFFGLTPYGRSIWNGYQKLMHKIDDTTTYEQQKLVEDTCRSMIASWKSDIEIYKTYKSSTDEEKLGWAEQAKIRANKTAASYNEYILKNSFVFKGNVPSDIYAVIDMIE